MFSRGAAWRLLLTAAVAAAAVFLCLGFWFTHSPWDATVLGRYSLSWFLGALLANAGIAAVTLVVLRAVWSRRTRHGRLPAGKRLLFSAVPTAALLAGLEVAVRFGQPSPTVGRSFRDFHAFLQHVERSEHDGAWVRSYGGRLYERRKTARLRIVCLGGSTTQSLGLEPQDQWPARMERLLRDRGEDVEVINAGWPWYTTAHSLVNYVLRIRHFSPDIVVVMHGINDLARSFPAAGELPFEPDYGTYAGPIRPLLNLKDAVDAGRGAGSRLLQCSALWRLLCRRTALDRMFYADLRRGRDPDYHAEGRDVPPEAFVSLASYAENLDCLVRVCLMDGRRVVLATQPSVYSREPAPGGPEPPNAMRVLNLTGPGGPVSRRSVAEAVRRIRGIVSAAAARHGVRIADLEAAIDARPELFRDDFHLNRAGCEIAAEACARTIQAILQEGAASQPVGG